MHLNAIRAKLRTATAKDVEVDRWEVVQNSPKRSPEWEAKTSKQGFFHPRKATVVKSFFFSRLPFWLFRFEKKVAWWPFSLWALRVGWLPMAAAAPGLRQDQLWRVALLSSRGADSLVFLALENQKPCRKMCFFLFQTNSWKTKLTFDFLLASGKSRSSQCNLAFWDDFHFGDPLPLTERRSRTLESIAMSWLHRLGSSRRSQPFV